MPEDDLDEMTAVAAPVSHERANRFYDRLRDNIRRYLASKSSVVGKTAEYLLLVPDVFMLMWRLVNDGRVSPKNKVFLGSGIAYFFFPLDIMPEAFLGPAGYVDDLVFAVYLLNKMLADTDPQVLREHWSGGDDVLHMIQKVLGAADNLVGKDMLARIKNWLK